MSDAVLPLHKLQERVLRLKSRVSEFNKPPTLRSPVRIGSLLSHRHYSVPDLTQRAEQTSPPPLKRVAVVAVDTKSLEKENSRLRTILGDNLAEQHKIHASLDLLRTELLSRAARISALTTENRQLTLFRDVNLPDLEAAAVERDREIGRLQDKLQSLSAHRRGPSFRLAVDRQATVAIAGEPIKDSPSEKEKLLQDINAKLEISVSAVLTRVCRSVACGIVTVLSDQGERRPHFLCIFLRTVELFEEPDDQNPIVRLALKSTRITVNSKSLALTFADTQDDFVVVVDAKPEKLEKWLVALRGLRVAVDYV